MSSGTDRKSIIKIDTQTSWGIVIGFFLLGGFGSLAIVPDSNFVSFIFAGCLVTFPFWAIFTESGARWAEDVTNSSDSNRTTQIQKNPEPSKESVCQNCGWQNADDNNFCHDCGKEIGSS